METRRQIIPLVGLLITMAAAAYMVVRLNAQTPAAEPFDLSNAVRAEVRDGQGRVVLAGQFAGATEDDGEIERTAALEPTGIDPDALGHVEIEMSGSGASKHQEIEFTVRNLQPNASFTFAIDGRDIATVSANSRGEAEVERDISLP